MCSCLPQLRNRKTSGHCGLPAIGVRDQMSPIYYIQVAIQRSWQFPSDPVQLAGFLVEYSSIPSKGAFLFNTTTDGGPRQRRNQRLDPMISDLILQAIDDKSEKPIDMFLPALIEDPTRSSAWQNSSHDRGLGYSCLQLYLPPQKSDRYVQEVCRTGDRIACVGIEFSTEPQILAHELSLRESIKVIRERCSRNGYTDPLDFWLLYACFRARAPDKSEKVWNDVLSEKPDAERWTWKNVHIMAQYKLSCTP